MEKDYKADFISFLKKKRVWMLYKRKFTLRWTNTDLSEWLSNTIPENYLLCAFFWGEKEKGSEYWLMLNKSWYAMNGFSCED